MGINNKRGQLGCIRRWAEIEGGLRPMGDRFGERGVNKGGYIGVKGGIRTYKG